MYGWCFLILYRCIVHVMPRPQIANGWAQNDSTTKGWREYLMTQLLDHCGQPKPTNFARKISGLCAVKFHKSVAGVMFLSRHITCVILYLRTSIVCNGFTPLWWFHILGQRCDWALGWSRPCCSTASTRFQLRTQLVMAPRVMGGGDDGRPLNYWYYFFWIFDCSPQDDGWRLWISFMTQKILDSRLVRCNQEIKDTHSIKAKRTSFPHSFF